MSRAVTLLGVVAAIGLAPARAEADDYRWPTANAPITSHYDNDAGSAVADYSCGTNTYNGHRGTDISVVVGTEVVAAATGTVVKRVDGFGTGYYGSTDGGGFGNHVILHHADGQNTIYAHLSANSGLPPEGTQISCGERIAGSGNSGNSTGPHLHFEIRDGVSSSAPYAGIATDPFAGQCSGETSLWNQQSGSNVSSTCSDDGGAPTDPPDPGTYDGASLVEELTIPAGTEVLVAQPFAKTWMVRNDGTSTWVSGYSLRQVSGDDLGASALSLSADPGEALNLTLLLTPRSPGEHRAVFRVSGPEGPFGDELVVEIEAVAAGDAPPSLSDGDGDGVGGAADCNDSDPNMRPGFIEACDGVDNDCSGVADDGLMRVCCDDGFQECVGGAWSECDAVCNETPNLTGGCAAAGGESPGLASMMLIAIAAALLRRRPRRSSLRRGRSRRLSGGGPPG